MSWTYRIGLSEAELEISLENKEVRESVFLALNELGVQIEQITPKEALALHVNETLQAGYKADSILRIDAPQAFSCSSLVSYLYTFAGVWMPSVSVDKYVFGTPISKEELVYGDLVFANSGEGRIWTESSEWSPGTPVPEGVDHVGVYVGEGKVLHASRRNPGVAIQDMGTSTSFGPKIVGYRRIADLSLSRYVVRIPDSLEPYKSKELFLKLLALLGQNRHLLLSSHPVPYISQLTDIGGDFWPSRACGGVAMAMALKYCGKDIESLVEFLDAAREKEVYVFPLGWYRYKLERYAHEFGVVHTGASKCDVKTLALKISEGSVALLSIEKNILGRKRPHVVLCVGVLIGDAGSPVAFQVHDPEATSRESGAYQFVETKHIESEWTGAVTFISK